MITVGDTDFKMRLTIVNRKQVNIEGHNVVLLVAQNGRKRKPEIIAKAAVVIIINQKTVYKVIYCYGFYVRSDHYSSS